MAAYEHGAVKAASILGMHPDTFGHVAELAGLGTLGLYPSYHLYKHVKDGEPYGQDAAELAGLGILAAPPVMHLLNHK